MIWASKIIGIQISDEYEEELYSLEKQDKYIYVKPQDDIFQEVVVEKKSFNKITKISMNKSFNSLLIKSKRKINIDDIKKMQWNTKNSYKDIYELPAIYAYKKIKFIQISKKKYIKIAKHKNNITKIVIYSNEPINSYIKKIGKNISINISPQIYSSKKQIIATRDIINYPIVIDPGHGGKDPGATGNRIKEKDVVFAIAKALYRNLKKMGYKNVYLTRYKNQFVSLKKRTHLANNKKAKLFISIHANATKNKKTQGIETYFLSPARSQRAKNAAAKENRNAIKKVSKLSKNIYLNMLNRSKIGKSEKLAIDIHKNMMFAIKQKRKKIIDHGVRSGPFWVLVGTLMPSVLIETGYVTNKDDAKWLKNPSYQDKIAKGIANGISIFLKRNK